MGSIRFYNARILTMEADVPILNGEVWVQGGSITLVGPPAAPLPIFAQEIDVKNNLLLPGFKNAHSHSPMVFARSYADDLPLQEWLHQQIFPLEALLTEQDAYELTKLAILEYLSSGITASFDMYLYPYAIAKASVELGFRTVLCGAVNNFTHSANELEQQYQTLNNTHPLLSMELGFHGEYTTEERILRDIAALAGQHKAPVYTHLSESKAEVADCLARTGMTPPQRLGALGLWDYGGGGFHGVHMTNEDMGLFKEKNLSLVSCPGSNSKLASGIPPLTSLVAQNTVVALGTDGAASNNALDFFREMYLATVLQKLAQNDAAALPADQVLRMATVAGATVMNLPLCDTVSVGKQADLIMLDLNQPNMRPLHNLEKNIVYSGSKSNIALTMIAGKILYQNGMYFVGESADSIYQKTEKIIQRITKQAMT